MDSESALPEIAPVAATESAGGLDFDLGDLGGPTVTEEPAQLATEAFGNTMPSLDIHTFQAPQFMPDTPADAGVLDLSNLDAQPVVDEVSKDSDFNFDVSTITPEEPNLSENAPEPNAFDLTTIDLNMDDKSHHIDMAEGAVAEAAEPEEMVMPGNEPVEVETKLDLVVAYIEMDDKEGAKELLDEVMKEGGAKQRKRAKELLAKLA